MLLDDFVVWLLLKYSACLCHPYLECPKGVYKIQDCIWYPKSTRIRVHDLQHLSILCLVGWRELCRHLAIYHAQGDWESAKAVGTGKYEDVKCNMVSITSSQQMFHQGHPSNNSNELD